MSPTRTRRRGRPSAPVVTDLATYPRRYVSPVQIARALNVPLRTVYYQIEKGGLPARRIRGVLRVPTAEARAYARDLHLISLQ